MMNYMLLIIILLTANSCRQGNLEEGAALSLSVNHEYEIDKNQFVYSWSDSSLTKKSGSFYVTKKLKPFVDEKSDFYQERLELQKTKFVDKSLDDKKIQTIYSKFDNKDFTDGAFDKQKLETALAALQTQNLALARFLLFEIKSSADLKIKASVNNALGVIAYRRGDRHEALFFFNEAVKSNSSDVAALLNLGFLNLKLGDHKEAYRIFSVFNSDQTGLIGRGIAAFLTDNKKDLNKICESAPRWLDALVLSFNCGVVKNNLGKNSEELKKSLNEMLKLTQSSELSLQLDYIKKRL